MFTRQEILAVVPNSQLLTPKSRLIKGISIDTRTIKPGELFIPIKGKNYAGHDFISAALKKGAVVLEVKDGLKALQNLAAYHRSKFKLPVIGVTGSVGKTTTKDMIASILGQEMNVLKNEENYNNEIGVPLTLLKLTKKHKAAVIEMGMQRLKEIELLAKIARPTIAVVTNIGEAHLEFLKTKKNIAKAKAEIFQSLRRQDHAVINRDDEYFEHLISNVQCSRFAGSRNNNKIAEAGQISNVQTFGIIEKADVSPKELDKIALPVSGEHNIYNALAAVAVAKILKLKKESIKKGLEIFHPSSQRMEVINCKNGTTIINDTYNANPQSVSAALKALSEMPTLHAPRSTVHGRRIAVLGDMFELGKTAKPAHRRILALAKRLKIDKVFTLGNLWPKPARPLKDKKMLLRALKKNIMPRDIILVKGSRGMQMEEVVEALV